MNPLPSADTPETEPVNLDLLDLLSFVDEIGIVAILILIIYGGFKRWWVFAWAYHDLQRRHDHLVEDRNRWMDLALRSADIVESFAEHKKERP